MPSQVTFTHPEPQPQSGRVWPVFLPFAGCPFRCIFCAQDKQTGQVETGLETVLRTLDHDLSEALDSGRGPYELAFYGGTFTALPSPWPETFLALAMRFREKGLITHVRCSTRPDCIDASRLDLLRAQGLDMMELGIQSFDSDALRLSGRGYDCETARKACRMVKNSGLALGIQLLPGLPGDTPGTFSSDVLEAAGMKPETARLYPCLVVRGTPLADLWERGRYTPWTLEQTIQELAAALPQFWAAGTRIIRLGLAPEETLEHNILAGPWQPALGQSIRGLALFHIIRKHVASFGRNITLLQVPRRYQGEFFGHGNELEENYARMGILKEAIRYVDEPVFTLS